MNRGIRVEAWGWARDGAIRLVALCHGAYATVATQELAMGGPAGVCGAVPATVPRRMEVPLPDLVGTVLGVVPPVPPPAGRQGIWGHVVIAVQGSDGRVWVGTWLGRGHGWMLDDGRTLAEAGADAEAEAGRDRAIRGSGSAQFGGVDGIGQAVLWAVTSAVAA